MDDNVACAADAPELIEQTTRRSGHSEALVMAAFWLAMASWVVGSCYTLGYPSESNEIALVMGMPAWVVWGVFLPWCLSTVFTIWFALCKMTDEDVTDFGGQGDG